MDNNGYEMITEIVLSEDEAMFYEIRKGFGSANGNVEIVLLLCSKSLVDIIHASEKTEQEIADYMKENDLRELRIMVIFPREALNLFSGEIRAKQVKKVAVDFEYMDYIALVAGEDNAEKNRWSIAWGKFWTRESLKEESEGMDCIL